MYGFESRNCSGTGRHGEIERSSRRCRHRTGACDGGRVAVLGQRKNGGTTSLACNSEDWESPEADACQADTNAIPAPPTGNLSNEASAHYFASWRGLYSHWATQVRTANPRVTIRDGRSPRSFDQNCRRSRITGRIGLTSNVGPHQGSIAKFHQVVGCGGSGIRTHGGRAPRSVSRAVHSSPLPSRSRRPHRKRTRNPAGAPLIWAKSSARPEASSLFDSAATALIRSAPMAQRRHLRHVAAVGTFPTDRSSIVWRRARVHTAVAFGGISSVTTFRVESLHATRRPPEPIQSPSGSRR